MKTHRLTIRLDAEELRGLQRLCDIAGASQTAVLQAMINEVANMYNMRGWTHPSQWIDDDVRESGMRFVTLAQKIDTLRRRRG